MKKVTKVLLVIFSILFIIFFFSLILFLLADYISSPKTKGENNLLNEGVVLIQAIGSLITSAGIIFTIILSWRKDKREIKELKLKVQELEKDTKFKT